MWYCTRPCHEWCAVRLKRRRCTNVRQDGSRSDIGYSRQPFLNASKSSYNIFIAGKTSQNTREHATLGPEIVQNLHLNYGHHLQSEPLTRLETRKRARQPSNLHVFQYWQYLNPHNSTMTSRIHTGNGSKDASQLRAPYTSGTAHCKPEIARHSTCLHLQQ